MEGGDYDDGDGAWREGIILGCRSASRIPLNGRLESKWVGVSPTYYFDNCSRKLHQSKEI